MMFMILGLCVKGFKVCVESTLSLQLLSKFEDSKSELVKHK